MSEDTEANLVSHCPHGIYIKDELCLTCLTMTSGNTLWCNNCATGGNWAWAEGHQANCAGLNPREECADDLPF